MVKKAKRAKAIRRLIIYPLVAGMLAVGAYHLKPKVEKMIEIAKASEGRFDISFINSYMKLLNKGIPPEVISQIPCYMLDDMIWYIESKKMPEQLIPHLTYSPEEYSITVAGHNPVFGADNEKVRDYIKEQLSRVPHLSREDADYEEDASQIDHIQNINMLYLVKGYIDYFKDENNRKEIGKLIREDLADPFSEHGGVVISNNGKYEFVSVNPLEEKVKNLEDNLSYSGEDWTKYIGAIGEYHFHAIKEDSSEYAGPSGSAQSDEEFLNGDISDLIRANEVNSYRIECVITKMKGNKFNADIYFRDVKVGPLDRKSNSKETTVLDLGVFDMPGD